VFQAATTAGKKAEGSHALTCRGGPPPKLFLFCGEKIRMVAFISGASSSSLYCNHKMNDEGKSSSSDSNNSIMNAPKRSGDQNNATNMVPPNSLNGHHRYTAAAHQNQLSRSMVILQSKVSLIDNTLAQGYSLKRARGELKKSNSDSMIHTKKRTKLPSYNNSAPVMISSTNLSSSFSSSSFGQIDPDEEKNLCPYLFIDSLLHDSSCSGASKDGPSSSRHLSKQNTQPLTDTDFLPPTPEQIEAYSNDAVSAVRSSDVDSLRELLSAGHSLECCNRFGESLLHVACRRSNAEIVSFLLNEAGVSPRIRDDYGRTPLHDACWRGNPEYEIVELLLSVEPRLAFVKDVRGHKPFQYARREHWGDWRKFLDEKRELILLPRSNSDGALRERDEPPSSSSRTI
jgi:hypothetical protein